MTNRQKLWGAILTYASVHSAMMHATNSAIEAKWEKKRDEAEARVNALLDELGVT